MRAKFVLKLIDFGKRFQRFLLVASRDDRIRSPRPQGFEFRVECERIDRHARLGPLSRASIRFLGMRLDGRVACKCMNPLHSSLSLASLMVVGLSWGDLSRAADPFTIVVLPDTQHYTDNEQNYAHFVAQSRWIGNNIAAENIVFTTHLGDIVESNGANALQWLRADRVLTRFDAYPSFPYGVALGNHDYDNVSSNPSDSADTYVSRFGAERYQGRPWYGGSSPDQRSHWQRFYAGGRVFHHITLEWQGASATNNNSPEVTNWVQSVLDAHPNTPTILTTHEYLGGPLGAGRSAAGDDIFNSLIRENSQIFLVIGGHALGENHRLVLNAVGEPVYEILANFQNLAEGGTGYLLLLKFDEDHGRIMASVYSPSLLMLKHGEASQYKIGRATRLNSSH